MVHWYHWLAFVGAVAVLLGLDLGVFHRRAHRVQLGEALAWTGVWFALAIAFCAVVALWLGGRAAGEFAAGYLIEWSLSVDNVFVFILLFTHFAVPQAYQHRVLFWGVVGAIVLRLSFILGGAALIERFSWAVPVFGVLLMVAAARFLKEDRRQGAIEEKAVLRVIRRFLPVTDGYRGERLLVRQNGRRVATPLLAVLLAIEASDVVFAVDSIPAIFAVTRHTFIVFSSNALAIMGLRSLYFVLARAAGRMRYLRPALAALLAFVGVKMLVSPWVHLPVGISLAVIVGILCIGAAASLVAAGRRPRAIEGPIAPAGR